MPTLIGKSAWTYVTSASSGGSGGAILQGGAAAGKIVVKDPKGQQSVFSFFAAGGGAGIGGKIKLGKLNIQLPGSTAGSLYSFPSTGTLYLTTKMKGTVDPIV